MRSIIVIESVSTNSGSLCEVRRVHDGICVTVNLSEQQVFVKLFAALHVTRETTFVQGNDSQIQTQINNRLRDAQTETLCVGGR